jgi:hypothetical protein
MPIDLNLCLKVGYSDKQRRSAIEPHIEMDKRVEKVKKLLKDSEPRFTVSEVEAPKALPKISPERLPVDKNRWGKDTK